MQNNRMSLLHRLCGGLPYFADTRNLLLR